MAARNHFRVPRTALGLPRPTDGPRRLPGSAPEPSGRIRPRTRHASGGPSLAAPGPRASQKLPSRREPMTRRARRVPPVRARFIAADEGGSVAPAGDAPVPRPGRPVVTEVAGIPSYDGRRAARAEEWPSSRCARDPSRVTSRRWCPDAGATRGDGAGAIHPGWSGVPVSCGRAPRRGASPRRRRPRRPPGPRRPPPSHRLDGTSPVGPGNGGPGGELGSRGSGLTTPGGIGSRDREVQLRGMG